jgi:predicted transcriptional regulator
MTKFSSMLSVEGQVIYLIGIGIASRKELIQRLGVGKQTVGKYINTLVDKKLIIVSASFRCPHCHKVIEGLSDLERVELTTEGKKYFDVIKPFMDGGNTT